MRVLKSFMFIISLSLLISCGGGGTGGSGGGGNVTPEPTLADLVKKSWTVSSASWDGTVQFSSTASTNEVSGYSAYKLDLSTSGSVKLTEFNGDAFTGSYSLSADGSQLLLTGLTSSNGAPSGTNGNLTFKIVTKPTKTSSTMTIETTAAYIKASNKVVKLDLK